MGGAVAQLDLEVLLRRRHRLEQCRVAVGQRQHLGEQRAVPPQQVLDPPRRQPGLPAELGDEVAHRGVAVSTDQRYVLGDRRRQGATSVEPGEVAGGRVHGVRRHHPVGRELAAGDRDEARLRPGHRVLAGQLARVLALPGQQGSQPGVDPDHVVALQRGRQHAVDRVQEVVDVGRGGGRDGPGRRTSRCPSCPRSSAVPTG